MRVPVQQSLYVGLEESWAHSMRYAKCSANQTGPHACKVPSLSNLLFPLLLVRSLLCFSLSVKHRHRRRR